MKALVPVLSCVLAVSAFGLVLLRRPEPPPDSAAVVEPQPVAREVDARTLETAVVPEIITEAGIHTGEKTVVMEPVEAPEVVQFDEQAVEPVEVPEDTRLDELGAESPVFTPVQTLEERGDAMLFEAQALLDTPFDQAITMPFDNL